MSTAGPNICTSGSNDATFGTTAWTNPGNITADDASYATCSTAASTSQLCMGSSFGFAIPTTATVTGLTVENKVKTAGGSQSCSAWAKLSVGNYGSRAITATTTEAWVSSGSSLFGFTSADWTPTVINGTGWAAGFQASTSGTETYSLNAVRVTVTYTVPSGYTNLPLMGVGLINTLIHGLTLGLCSWRWRPFTRTQTRTAGVMA